MNLNSGMPDQTILRAVRHRLANMLLQHEDAYSLYLFLKGGRFQKMGLPMLGANRNLSDQAEVEKAIQELKKRRMILHSDRVKNWDSLIALSLILHNTTPSDPVLDAGGLPGSNLLPNLYLSGYRRLEAANVIFSQTFRRGPIVYRPMDITCTDYSDNHFAAVFCQSVIEHGIDLEAFFKEMARIIRPQAQGLLILSTDFWPEKIQSTGSAYGAPICIFSKQEICEMLEIAQQYGFKTISKIDWSTNERPVFWEVPNVAFTFILLAFRLA